MFDATHGCPVRMLNRIWVTKQMADIGIKTDCCLQWAFCFIRLLFFSNFSHSKWRWACNIKTARFHCRQNGGAEFAGLDFEGLDFDGPNRRGVFWRTWILTDQIYKWTCMMTGQESERPPVALVPCGRARFCTSCTDRLVAMGSACPVCHSRIDMVLRLFNWYVGTSSRLN